MARDTIKTVNGANLATNINQAPNDALLSNARFTAIILGGVLLTSFLLPLPDVHGRILGLPSICPFYETTGLPCPGCGLTRSFVCFAHGRIREAFDWNLLGPPLWLVFLFLFVRSLATVVKKQAVWPFCQRFVARSSWAALFMLFTFGIGRILYLTIEHKKF